MDILGIDIAKALTPDVPIQETIIRGFFMYVVVFTLIRYVLRGRTSAAMPDLLVLVLIADAAQNAMSNDYTSVTNGVVLVMTIIFTAFAFDWLAYHVPVFRSFAHRDPQPLIISGRADESTLHRELINEQDLHTQLRLAGLERMSDVRAAYLEGTGEVSVIKEDGSSSAGKGNKRSGAGAGA
jgi:uncharacterized membrane protein YcaP (DUF421 family)